MPVIDGGDADRGYNPRLGGRPRKNRLKLLATAASVMSVMLPVDFVTTLLVWRIDGAPRKGHCISGAQIYWRRFPNGLRSVDDFDLGLAGARMAGLPLDSALSTAFRHGAALVTLAPLVLVLFA